MKRRLSRPGMRAVWCVSLCIVLAPRAPARAQDLLADALNGDDVDVGLVDLFQSPHILYYCNAEPGSQPVSPFIAFASPATLPLPGVDGATGVLQSVGLPPRLLGSSLRGTIMFWFRAPAGGYTAQAGTFNLARFAIPGKPGAPAYELGFGNLNSSAFGEWRADMEWHHLCWSWDAERRLNRLYLDATPWGQVALPQGVNLFVVADHLRHVAIAGYGALFDEIYLLDRAVDDAFVAAAVEGRGKPVLEGDAYPKPPKSYAALLRNRLTASATGGTPGSRVERLIEADARPPWLAEFDASRTRQTTPTRERLCLNGYWRYQPLPAPWQAPDPEAWRFVRIPGRDFGADAAGWRVLDVDGSDLTFPLGKLRAEDVNGAYFEKDAAVPAQWISPGRTMLFLQGLDAKGPERHLMINGHYVTALPHKTCRLDISDYVEPGRGTRLTIFSVDGWTFLRDVWLEYVRHGVATVDEIWLQSSVRRHELRVQAEITNLTSRAVSGVLSGWIAPEGALDREFELEPRRVTLAPRERQTVDFVYPWQHPHLWHVRDPFLYEAHVTFTVAGQTVDHAFPETFGFKELWIRNDRFMLNDTPIHFKMYSNDGAYANMRDDRALLGGILTFVRNRKTLDLNAIRDFTRHGSHHLFSILDREGMFNVASFGQPSRNLNGAGITNKAAGMAVLESYVSGKYGARDWCWEYRNHPSTAVVLCGWGSKNYWVRGANYACNMTLAYRDKAIAEQGIGLWQEHEDWLAEYWRALAPTRLLLNYFSGAFGLHKGIMGYHNFSQPLQEIEEQWSEWAQEGAWPAFNTEFMFVPASMCFNSHHVVENRTPIPDSESIVQEQSASYLGDAAYTRESDDFLAGLAKEWRGGKAVEKGGGYQSEIRSEVNWAMRELYGRRILRMYRFYGVSQGYHVEANNGVTFDPQVPALPVGPEVDAVAAPGLFPDSGPRRIRLQEPRETRYLHHGKTWAQHATPWYAFIAGPYRNHKADYALKDHAFFAGETVEKGIAFINDHVEDFDGAFEWNLMDEEHAVASGETTVNCPAGERRVVNFSFTVPRVHARRDFTLTLHAVNPARPIRADRFAIQVLPAPRASHLGKRMAILDDAEERLSSYFASQGIPFEDVRKTRSLAGVGILIVGRVALDDRGQVMVRDLGLNRAVENGLSVLVMEQRPVVAGEGEKKKGFELYLPDVPSRQESVVLGLRADERRTRHVFLRSPAHPIVDGLRNEDFRDWRGSSDFEEEHPVTTRGINVRFKSLRRFPRWSNKGIVSFYPLEKPQCGGFRTLLDCEYDLFLTPLLETRRGKGTVIVSQLDMTGRLHSDPVARTLFHNLLAYLDARPPATVCRVVFFGDPTGAEALRRTGVVFAEAPSPTELGEADVLVVAAETLRTTLTVREAHAAGLKAMTREAESLRLAETSLDANDDDGLEDFGLDIDDGKGKQPPLAPGTQRRLATLNAARAAVTAFVQAGGTLVVLPVRDRRATEWLPIGLSVEARPVPRTDRVPSHSLFMGIGVSDFFWRGPRTVSVFSGLPTGAAVTDSGVMAAVAVGKGTIVLLGMHPGSVPDPRGNTKINRLWSTLLFNLGCQFTQALDLERMLYQDDKFPYYTRTIDFEPYDHGYY